MKKNGFTVAEILVTLAIVGVVAALTIPALVTNQRRQVYASTLATAVANFETAMTTIILQEGVDDLLDTEAWDAVSNNLDATTSDASIRSFVYNIGKHIPFSGYNKTQKAYRVLENNGNENNYESCVSFIAKNGIEYQINIPNVSKNEAKSEQVVLASGSNYVNRAAIVNIDVNGNGAPNILGRDFFRFELGVDGRLYPFGGQDYCQYHEEQYADLRTKCIDDKEGDYCAAYLMQNGYEMDY